VCVAYIDDLRFQLRRDRTLRMVYMNAKDPKPSQELHSREALAPVFADLNQYDATTHFVGQSTIFTLNGDRATGEAYCVAHHVTVDGEKRSCPAARRRAWQRAGLTPPQPPTRFRACWRCFTQNSSSQSKCWLTVITVSTATLCIHRQLGNEADARDHSLDQIP
jgi:hypothetical protein